MIIDSDEQACMSLVAYILHILLKTEDALQHRVEPMKMWSQPVWPDLRSASLAERVQNVAPYKILCGADCLDVGPTVHQVPEYLQYSDRAGSCYGSDDTASNV
jgi:hypothetical protein